MVLVSWLYFVKHYLWFCRMFETFLSIACATLSLSLVGFNSWRLYSQQSVADCFPPSPKQQRSFLPCRVPQPMHQLRVVAIVDGSRCPAGVCVRPAVASSHVHNSTVVPALHLPLHPFLLGSFSCSRFRRQYRWGCSYHTKIPCLWAFSSI